MHFASSAEALRSSVKYIDETNNYSREGTIHLYFCFISSKFLIFSNTNFCYLLGVERLLSHNGREKDKRDAWKSWYQELNPLVRNFSYILSLAEKAAKANG